MKPIIGKHTYIGRDFIVKEGLGDAKLNQHGIKCTIGNFCSIADYLILYLAFDHDSSILTTFPFHVKWKYSSQVQPLKSKGSIIIGSDVWIGSHVIIMSGVTIGDGAVIGANSVVTKDVGEYCVAAGNPARTVRKRFTDEQIHHLTKIKWWDWPDETIKANLQYIMSRDTDRFINMFKDK